MLPAALSGVREVVAYGHSIKGEVRVFDVEGAYVQSPLGGARTFGRPNSRLWPPHWHGRFRRRASSAVWPLHGRPRPLRRAETETAAQQPARLRVLDLASSCGAVNQPPPEACTRA